VVRRDLYSPIPEVPAKGWPGWTRRHPLPGLRLDPEAQLRLLADELGSYAAEFTAPRKADRPGDYYLDNGYYGGADAAVLHAMIRWTKPRRILELGGGFSTLVSAAACRANGQEGHPVEMLSVDPAPRVEMPEHLSGYVRQERADVHGLGLRPFLDLEAKDVLFIDTSHSVKLGSEVNFLFLEVFPLLRPGVLVHIHDVFLPYEYPRDWFLGGMHLNEQYLLHALLVESPHWEVLLALHALKREHPARVGHSIDYLDDPGYGPAAMWLRREGP